MNRVLVAIGFSSILVGCSTFSSNDSNSVEAPAITAIANQSLSSNFVRKGIKVEWECTHKKGIIIKSCERSALKSIEVTGYATAYGNSEALRENAFKVAELKAKSKLRHFIHEDVHSHSVVNTFVKNIEKANDNIVSKIGNDDSKVEITDEEANGGGGNNRSNTASRNNNNNVVQTVTTVITSNAQGILRGVYPIEEKIVDRQTVSVTIRWDKQSDRSSATLLRTFGGQN